MIDAVALRVGSKILLENEIYVVTAFQHQFLGRGRGQVVVKVKNLQTGRALEKCFRSEQKFPIPDLDNRKVQYLYRDTEFHFMDNETYEQFALSEDVVGDAADYLKETLSYDMLFFNGEPLRLELPTFLQLTVTETDPGFKGDTVSNVTKPATLETGAVVQVPMFIEVGNVLKIDTRTGEYVERV